MIDPAKEVKALSDLVRNGFSSWHDAVKSLGENPDKVLALATKRVPESICERIFLIKS